VSFSSPEALLTQVGWPSDFLNHRGALSWSTVLSEDTVNPLKTTLASAAVLVNDALITFRYRTATLGGQISPQFEAKWDLSSGAPVLSSYKELGEAQPLNEPQALQSLLGRLLLMKASPSFQPMAVRKPPAVAVVAPRTGF